MVRHVFCRRRRRREERREVGRGNQEEDMRGGGSNSGRSGDGKYIRHKSEQDRGNEKKKK